MNGTTAATTTSPPTATADRFLRQRDLVPAERLEKVSASIIGTGAIGRQAALQWAAIGTPRIQQVDFDGVDQTNLTTQGNLASEVGQPKVLATVQAIGRLDPSIQVDTLQDRWRSNCRWVGPCSAVSIRSPWGASRKMFTAVGSEGDQGAGLVFVLDEAGAVGFAGDDVGGFAPSGSFSPGPTSGN